MPVSWKDHAGKRLLLADFSNQIREEDLLRTLEAAMKIIVQSLVPLRILVDIRGCNLPPRVMARAKELATPEATKKCERVAVIGVDSGIRRILLNAYTRATKSPMRAFDTEDVALAHLTEG
ncbi:MAG TPA: hypothetical protein PK668_09120 [Myxococcota bacterium]|nr:hypothetical protein [Myxococcota bacterium]HRY92859.1 hypothetical protein [Myxococcota bacterium]HSA22262.1 hypothetical protein [Myxococcota bacterium]